MVSEEATAFAAASGPAEAGTDVEAGSTVTGGDGEAGFSPPLHADAIREMMPMVTIRYALRRKCSGIGQG